MSKVSRLKRYKNPKIIGPGVWWAGHQACEDAVVAADVASFEFAFRYITMLRAKFACLDCRNHIEAFCLASNPEIYRPTYDANGKIVKPHDAQGLASWFHALHSVADREAGVPTEDYGDVMTFFRTDAGVCPEDCTKDSDIEKTPTTFHSRPHTGASFVHPGTHSAGASFVHPGTHSAGASFVHPGTHSAGASFVHPGTHKPAPKVGVVTSTGFTILGRR